MAATEAQQINLIAAVGRRVTHELWMIDCADHDPTHSPHDGYAKILAETEQLWTLIRDGAGTDSDAILACIRIATAALRYPLELCDDIMTEPEPPAPYKLWVEQARADSLRAIAEEAGHLIPNHA